ncbi:unnamed protein product [Cylicocyclus nassatus]|uniref:Uncharacterized protein n=1 Tax=Cylicocyclus nassatus TaxID=53992 RepID=A0AA36DQF7_CYLNA|nr:unnamed protein product [Cylicocyclus nassatus]
MQLYILSLTVLIVAIYAKSEPKPTGRFGWPKATCEKPIPDNFNKNFKKHFRKQFHNHLKYDCKLNNRADQYMHGRPIHEKERQAYNITMDVFKMKFTPKKLALRVVKEKSNRQFFNKLKKKTSFGCAYLYEPYEEQVQLLKWGRKFVAYVKRTNTTVICVYREPAPKSSKLE